MYMFKIFRFWILSSFVMYIVRAWARVYCLQNNNTANFLTLKHGPYIAMSRICPIFCVFHMFPEWQYIYILFIYLTFKCNYRILIFVIKICFHLLFNTLSRVLVAAAQSLRCTHAKHFPSSTRYFEMSNVTN